MSNLAKYGSYDIETANHELQDLEGAFSDTVKLEQGDNPVRFLPPVPGKNSPFRVIFTHFINLPGVAKPVVFVCPRREANKPCPVCNEADRLYKSGNEADSKRAKDLWPKRQVHANVIDRKRPEAGVSILRFGKMIHEQLIELRKNPDWGGDFTDPVNGFDVNIKRKGSDKNSTEYLVTPKRATPLSSEELVLLDQQIDLERFAKVLTAEQIKEKLSNPGGDASQAEAAPKAKRHPNVVDGVSQEIPGDDVPY